MIFVMSSMWDTVSKNYIRMVKERPELKATAIAEAAGVTRDMVYKWNKGENIPDVDKIDSLARFFRVEPLDFYKGGEGLIPFYGNLPLRKYLVVRDDIISDLGEFASDDPIWDNLKKFIQLQKRVGAPEKKPG